jgi:hypothetical protein
VSPLVPRMLGRLVSAVIALGIGGGGFVVLRDVFHVGAMAGAYAALLALVLAVALVITLGD